MKQQDFRQFAKEAARAAADKKAIDIRILDLRQQSEVADYIVVAGVESSAQMIAIETSVDHTLRELGLSRLHRDGKPGGRWIALDYGGLIVHIMMPQAREFYRLESMWEKPKAVAWEETPQPVVKKKRKSK
jgi:ribosome-associated protein